MSLSKPVNTLIEEAIVRLRNETGVDASAASSVARSLIESSCRQTKELWDDFVADDSGKRLATASGSRLDELAALVGISRRSVWVAVSSSLGMRFSLAQAQSSSVTIEKGTIVWPPDDPSRYFTTTAALVIPAGDTTGYTGIRAPYAGEFYAATIGELTSHNASTALSCVNLEAISGTSAEDDENFRYRIGLALQARNGSVPAAIRLKVLEFPGVVDVRLLPFRRGAGTFDVVVTTAESTPSVAKLNDIKDYILDNVAAYGISVNVTGPNVSTIDVTVRVGFTNKASASDKLSARQLASSVLQQYLNTLDVGESLYMDRLENVVLNVSAKIADVAVTSLAVNGVYRTPDAVSVDTYTRIIAGRIEVI